MAFELGSALIGLGGVVVGGLISSGTTWLMAYTDRNKFARERTWDLRREAYTDIVAKLMAADSWAKLIDQRYSEDPHTYDAAQDVRDHTNQFAQYYQQAKAAYTKNRLIISDEFVARFELMMAALVEVEGNQVLIPMEAAGVVYQITNEAFTDLMEIGFRETVSGI